MIKRLLLLCCLAFLGFALSARADSLYVGSQAGLCCFNVDLNLNTVTDTMAVTVTLTHGAQYFVDTGGPHPGFAMNITGATPSNISISNVSSPWTLADVQVASTNAGPTLGNFDFDVTNPGKGANAHNAGPLTFDVAGKGLILSYGMFAPNADGYYFAADIMDSTGATGESGISKPPTPPPPSTVAEPSSLFLLGTGLAGIAALLRRRSNGI